MPIRTYYDINVNANKSTLQVRNQAMRIVKNAKRRMLLAKTKGLTEDVNRYNKYIDLANKGVERALDINAKKGRDKRIFALTNG